MAFNGEPFVFVIRFSKKKKFGFIGQYIGSRLSKIELSVHPYWKHTWRYF